MEEREKKNYKTFYYEGIHGMREALQYHVDEMKGKELIGFYASDHDAPAELVEIFLKWNEETRKRNTTTRVIVPNHPSLKKWRELDIAHGRTAKVIPYEEYSANISIDAGDTFVRILMFKELQAVIIENPDVARTMKQIFEIVWKNRPEKEKGAVFEKKE